MYERHDTIVGVATSVGRSALAIVRVSGSSSFSIMYRIFTRKRDTIQIPEVLQHRHAHHGFIYNPADHRIIDEVIVTLYPGPASFSGEDMVEISCHGNPLIIELIVALFLNQGVRLAGPGEFTFRAFMNDRMDLTQAEAVSDLIEAKTEKSLSLSLQQLHGELSAEICRLQIRLRDIYSRFVLAVDFPEEDIPDIDLTAMSEGLDVVRLNLEALIQTIPHSLAIKNGSTVAIVGIPNVGKSSLLNFFLRTDRAIVTTHPGTTRDSIEESIMCDGLLINLIDTAGIRSTDDPVESEGVRRTFDIIQRAQILIVLLEPNLKLQSSEASFLETTKSIPRILAFNKIDLKDPQTLPDEISGEPVLKVSIRNKTGLDLLRKNLVAKLTASNIFPHPQSDDHLPCLTNVRQQRACQQALNCVSNAVLGIRKQLTEEVIAFEIEQALSHLADLVGKTTPDDILHDIFSQFCIGK